MSHPPRTQSQPGTQFHSFVESAVLSIVFPVLQVFLLTLASITDPGATTSDPAGYIRLLATAFGGIPALLTLSGWVYATYRGRILGFFGYILGAGGGNQLFTAPSRAVVLMLVGSVMIAVGIKLRQASHS